MCISKNVCMCKLHTHTGLSIFISTYLSDDRVLSLCLSPTTAVYIITCIHTYMHTCIHAQMHYITLRYITLHYIILHYIKLPYITLHYITLHYITLHYTTLHYTTSRHITAHHIHTHRHTDRLTGRCLGFEVNRRSKA